MYMARPDKILHAFYIRHDRFRVRIDDQNITYRVISLTLKITRDMNHEVSTR